MWGVLRQQAEEVNGTRSGRSWRPGERIWSLPKSNKEPSEQGGQCNQDVTLERSLQMPHGDRLTRGNTKGQVPISRW